MADYIKLDDHTIIYRSCGTQFIDLKNNTRWWINSPTPYFNHKASIEIKWIDGDATILCPETNSEVVDSRLYPEIKQMLIDYEIFGTL